MTHATPTQPTDTDPAPRDWPLVRSDVRVRIAVLAAAFIALHFEIIARLARIAWVDGDWSHALLIPFICAYIVYQQRDRLAAVIYRTCWPALAIVAAAVVVYGWALLHGYDTLKGYALIANLFGLVLLLAGPGAMRILVLPVLYLAFAVKLPDALWADVAWYFQITAAHASVYTLWLLGVDAEVSVTAIHLWHDGQSLGSLNVAEACSGMRMLMTFLALSVVIAYLSPERSWWARLTLCVVAIPIAMLANIGRVTVLGLAYMIDPEYARGDFHLLLGMFMLVPAVLMYAGVWWVVEKFDDHAPAPGNENESAPVAKDPEAPAS